MTHLKTIFAVVGLGCAASFAVGCASGRAPEVYRDDTQKLIDGTHQAVSDCYTAALKADRKAQGSVTVNFTVQEGTGKFTNIAVDKAKSSAPEAVQQCVTNQLQSLTLSPADDLRGEATFSWDFKAKEPPAPAPATDAPAT
ncbi:MAG: AgmX/PglI C-terminal domain-containing protein [Polyangiaceae bacterium]